MIVVGVDVHKQSLTAVAVHDRGSGLAFAQTSRKQRRGFMRIA